MSEEMKKAAYEKALLEMCGLENIEDLSGHNIRYDRTVVDGMFDAGHDHAAAEMREIREKAEALVASVERQFIEIENWKADVCCYPGELVDAADADVKEKLAALKAVLEK